jgi:hypothetical protein
MIPIILVLPLRNCQIWAIREKLIISALIFSSLRLELQLDVVDEERKRSE